MARPSHPPSEPARLGKQPPRYRFFLNPYADARFTTCPQCSGKTRVRKLPLVIHIDPLQLIALNKTCRYCPRCDLLIAHQDEIEAFLAGVLEVNDRIVSRKPGAGAKGLDLGTKITRTGHTPGRTGGTGRYRAQRPAVAGPRAIAKVVRPVVPWRR